MRVPSDDVLDLRVVENTRRIFKAKYSEMVGYYIEDTDKYIHEIEDALERSDFAAAIRPSHTLKSTSQRMGAVKISTLAGALELQARQAAEGTAPANPQELKKSAAGNHSPARPNSARLAPISRLAMAPPPRRIQAIEVFAKNIN